MRRIIFGLFLIVGAATALGIGSTGAFFSDTETSTGNTFAAGAIDLKIDNESYYNGNKCAEVTPGVFQWQGTALFPVPGTPCTTSWQLSDLNKGLLFFNFTDIKPSDNGEDTISLHVDTNPAYACMDVTLTSNKDNTSTTPELAAGDTPADPNNSWDGELAQHVQFFWWADDGDNVYEQGENSISGGVKTLMNLASTTGPFSVALSDAGHNVWDPNNVGPIPGNTTKYIGKMWCFGTLSLASVSQDGQGHLPNSTNGPQVRGSGFTCDGHLETNITQTDSATVDVSFRAIQSRNNGRFLCGQKEGLAKITVNKVVHNINGGNNVVADFHLFVDNGVVTTPVTSGVTTTVSPNTYAVEETGVSGYVATFSGDCDAEGNIVLNAGDNKVCTITNTDLPANITLVKVVSSGTADPSTFKMRVDGTLVPNTTSIAVTSNSPHTITEDAKIGYHFTSMTGTGCPAVLGGTATLNEGQAITCTITNTAN